MSIKTINIISVICAALSLLLVFFACFAPFLFTRVAYSSKCVFSETGQIGDTIGGTMSPIVAIAGVFMTFIAFLMQVNANRIQSEQLKKSFNIKRLEEKIDSRKALQLLYIDINVMIQEIDIITNKIDSFCKKTKARPTGNVEFPFVSEKSLKRYLSIDRNLLFNAFVSFIDGDDKIEVFRTTYSLMDYYSDSFPMINDNIYKYTDDIMECNNEIKHDFNNLYDNVCLFSSSDNEPTKMLVKTYKKDVNERLKKNDILDIYELHKHLEDGRFASLYDYCGKESKNVKDLVNRFLSLNENFVKILDDYKNELLETEKYDQLNNIKDKIGRALRVNTIESIQNQFEQLN